LTGGGDGCLAGGACEAVSMAAVRIPIRLVTTIL
jgi:hypothetical protein